MEKLLEGKVALVTGSTHGIGRRVAEIFRESGAIGLGIERTDTDNSSSDDWLFHEGDITDENTLKEATKKIKEHFGRLDIVVANAGVTRESGWLYFVDKDGDVSRAKMARGRK